MHGRAALVPPSRLHTDPRRVSGIEPRETATEVLLLSAAPRTAPLGSWGMSISFRCPIASLLTHASSRQGKIRRSKAEVENIMVKVMSPAGITESSSE